jgi:acetyl-CoA carboxylase biotin carboxyl carrier protein
MTAGLPAASGPAPPPEPGEDAAVPADLDEVRRHAVALLADLDRPPRTLHIQAGRIVVDITWPEGSEAVDVHAGNGNGAAATAANGHGPAAAAPADAPVGECLTSPAVGVFYHAREPGAAPFVSVGEEVRSGQQVGIVEAMKLMIPVEADRGGRISAVLKANGQPVEYGEPLFALESGPAGE